MLHPRYIWILVAVGGSELALIAAIFTTLIVLLVINQLTTLNWVVIGWLASLILLIPVIPWVAKQVWAHWKSQALKAVETKINQKLAKRKSNLRIDLTHI